MEEKTNENERKRAQKYKLMKIHCKKSEKKFKKIKEEFNPSRKIKNEKATKTEKEKKKYESNNKNREKEINEKEKEKKKKNGHCKI